jgi:hypothetical protein
MRTFSKLILGTVLVGTLSIFANPARAEFVDVDREIYQTNNHNYGWFDNHNRNYCHYQRFGNRHRDNFRYCENSRSIRHHRRLIRDHYNRDWYNDRDQNVYYHRNRVYNNRHNRTYFRFGIFSN